MQSVKRWAVTFLIFFVLESFGLLLGWRLMSSITVQPATNLSYSVAFFAYLLVITAIMIGLIRYLPRAMKLVELATVFIGSEVFFEILFMGLPYSSVPSIILALLITYLRLVYPENLVSLDLAAITTLLGVGPALGVSLGLIPALVLLALLAVYDYISVFKTKHMVTLAKGVMKENLAFMAAVPIDGRVFHIGGGDIVIPMMTAVSILSSDGITAAIISLVGGLLGLTILIAYLSKHKGKIMPALPPIAMGMLLAYGMYLTVVALV